MKNSKFTEAYLAIIKEENNQFEEVAANEDSTTSTTIENNEQCVCFKTSDKNLIDAIKSGFEEVVFFVNAKDETTGEDTVTEVKFGPESFKDLEVKAAETDENVCPECGNAECTCECGDGNTFNEEGEEDTGSGGGADPVSEEIEEDEDPTSEEGEEDADPTNEEDEIGMEEIDPSEWLEDGVCVKCGNPECDGSCKCKKCGSQNCIGDCEAEDIKNEDDEGGEDGGAEI